MSDLSRTDPLGTLTDMSNNIEPRVVPDEVWEDLNEEQRLAHIEWEDMSEDERDEARGLGTKYDDEGEK